MSTSLSPAMKLAMSVVLIGLTACSTGSRSDSGTAGAGSTAPGASPGTGSTPGSSGQSNLPGSPPPPSTQWQHRALLPGEVAVDSPGSYAQAGTTYVLTQDVSSATSPIFLGKDVTLDLNGYSITYAAASYEHVPNYGFEAGTQGWDMSGAPGAAVEDTATIKPFIGQRILRLPAGQEIVSPYVNLPVADRAYYAMCGVLSNSMRVTVSVEDAAGQPVRCAFSFGSTTRQTCPQTGTTKLGGGFVFALLHDLPAGRYRIRVKAETDCLIDEVDIRPALDVGVSIIERTQPWAYLRCIFDGDACAFFDYTKPGTTSTPLDGLASVSGSGAITIRNGVIRSGFEGIRSWGVQSTAGGVDLRLENLQFVAGGINTNAVNHTGRASVQSCRFDIDTPFIIDRHRLSDSPVSIEGAGSEIAGCEFVGGQGCLSVSGDDSLIHDNLFVNRQTVTNHYSVILGGVERVKVYDNQFDPDVGSGLLMFRARNCEVFDNAFTIATADGNCEYTNEDYSTNAIRITDYNAALGASNGAYGNRIHHNRFDITGKHYTNYSGFRGVASAFFISVGGGANQIHDNQIAVNDTALGSPSIAYAFYLGGSNQAGEYYNNVVDTNVPAFWCATYYGSTSNALIRNNTIRKTVGAPAGFQPFRFGYGGYTATTIEFVGNAYVDCQFGIESSGSGHTYTRR